MKRGLAAAALVATVVVGFALASGSGDGDSQAERAQRLSARLRCPVCEGLSVADSSSSTARAIKDDVERRVEAGDSDDEILQAYVDRYGEWILLTPRADGVGSVVWLVPVAVLFVGAGLLGLALWRWRRAPAAGDPELRARSLEEIEAEHAEGEIDDEAYERLRARYTAPAAEPPPAARRRRAVVTAVVVAFSVLAAALLAGSLGERLPGGTATGNDQAGEGRGTRAARLADLARAVERRPRDAGSRMEYAEALLQEGRASEALEQYDAAAGLAPGNAEPRAYGGWIVLLAGLPEEALDRLDQAAAADRSFPDTYFFRGVVRLRLGQEGRAADDLRRYLALAPGGPYEEEARVALREARGRTDDDAGSDR